MGSESPLHKALAAWRIAEHRLDEAPPDDMDALEAALIAQSDLQAAGRAPQAPPSSTGPRHP